MKWLPELTNNRNFYDISPESTDKSGGSHLKCSRSERSDYSGSKSAYGRLLDARTGRFDVFAYAESLLFPSLRLCNPLSGQASEHCLITVVSHTV